MDLRRSTCQVRNPSAEHRLRIRELSSVCRTTNVNGDPLTSQSAGTIGAMSLATCSGTGGCWLADSAIAPRQQQSVNRGLRAIVEAGTNRVEAQLRTAQMVARSN